MACKTGCESNYKELDCKCWGDISSGDTCPSSDWDGEIEESDCAKNWDATCCTDNDCPAKPCFCAGDFFQPAKRGRKTCTKKRGFTGDTVDCCFGREDPCNCSSPDQCANEETSICKTALKTYCSDDNLVNDKDCLGWCNSNEDSCRENVKNYCQGANLISSTCKSLCEGNSISSSNKDSVCQDNLKEFCADKDIADPKYQDICGCYYSSDEYQKLFTDLEKQGLNIKGLIPHACLDICNSAKIKPQEPITCNIELMQCINKVINNGKITGNIKVVTECKQFIKNNTTSSTTSSGSTTSSSGSTTSSSGSTTSSSGSTTSSPSKPGTNIFVNLFNDIKNFFMADTTNKIILAVVILLIILIFCFFIYNVFF